MTTILYNKGGWFMGNILTSFLGLFKSFKIAPVYVKQNKFWNSFLFLSVTMVLKKGATTFLEVISYLL